MDKDFYDLCRQKARLMRQSYSVTRREIEKVYKIEFTILEGFFDFTYELGNALDKYIPQPEKPYLQFSLLRIHEKALKVARESKIMLENGSSSGAMARWRTLFEFSVVASILVKYPDLSKKYIDHTKVDDYKYAKKLVEYRERLNLYNYNMDVFPDIEASFKAVAEEYGWNGKNGYEWAKNDSVKAPNLFDLSKEVGLEHFYAYVDESHQYNHPSMRYLLNDRGSKSQEDDSVNYLFSPFGMYLPIQLIACSLYHVNLAVIQGYSSLDAADQEQLSFYLLQNGEFPKTIIELVEKADLHGRSYYAD